MNAIIRQEIGLPFVKNIGLVQIRCDDSGGLTLFQAIRQRAFAFWTFATNHLAGPERHSFYRRCMDAGE